MPSAHINICYAPLNRLTVSFQTCVLRAKQAISQKAPLTDQASFFPFKTPEDLALPKA